MIVIIRKNEAIRAKKTCNIRPIATAQRIWNLEKYKNRKYTYEPEKTYQFCICTWHAQKYIRIGGFSLQVMSDVQFKKSKKRIS
jgi:hypothetical protein